MGETTLDDERSPLLPDRHQQADFFVCDVFDAAPKGDMASMEHPIFSLSTKPDRRVRTYRNGSNYLEVKPSSDGLASIHDRDILIYCISQAIAKINAGQPVDRRMTFHAKELLLATNRPTGGEAYVRLKAALSRLHGTKIETNIVTGGQEELDAFGLIDAFKIIRQTRDGRMQTVQVTLSDWVFNAIRHKEVLTLHRDYFRLRKPLERRMYELARKHCGQKSEWKISLDRLQDKCGSASTLKEFRRLVSTIVEQDAAHAHMPDYAVTLADDMVIFRNRGTLPTAFAPDAGSGPALQPETYHEARLAAPSWDVRHLETQWHNWCAAEEIEPKRPDAHFLKFCRSWYEKRGRA
ncbi:MAG: replication initiator protein A [Rhizobiaceae bacterium]|nr:replication initiator protein A [Rhizobiaceae bacterium]